MQLFNEPKYKDTFVQNVYIQKIVGKFSTYDPKNNLNLNA